MSQEIVPQVFDSEEFGTIRTIVRDGNPLFCGSDVAKALGYAKPNNALNTHCKGTPIQGTLQTQGGPQTVRFITEGDMYRLIASSKLESAQRFESWVFDEVIPSIRKHGAYATHQTIESIIADPRNGIRLLQALADEQDRNRKLQAENKEMEPKAFFADSVSRSKTSVLVGVMAKILNQNGYRTGQNRFFKTLCNDGYLIGTKGRNYHMPTQRALDMGLFEVKESTRTHSDGHTSIDRTTLVTGKGQVYFVNRYCGGEVD
ncbi:MAG: phage antirepressor [Parafannyhessea sp.]|uniref:phage antirepressor n=1 Tax=Parafannyhessea sp. TaxID=2847324 RepID=UPI003F042686